MTILIDTNVILDVFLRREPFFEASYGAIRKAIEEDADCFVSASAATDLFYILRKNLQSGEQARAYLRDLSQLARFADVQEADIDAALLSDMSDFEDAVADAVADRIGAAYIVTRNVKDFSDAKVAAITPSEYQNTTKP